MSTNAHDPPATGPVDPIAYQHEPPFTDEQLAALHVARHATYALMKDRLHGVEPLELIRVMKHGGYRFKSKRGYPGVLVTSKGGDPVPERMSFRQIAPILSAQSGVQVTYETVRRWWEAVCPDEPDEDPEPEEAVGPPMVEHTTRSARRITRRRTPTVGDDHAEAIRAATERAKSTNPAVPAAAFLPPAE